MPENYNVPETLDELEQLTTVENIGRYCFVGEEHTPPGAPICKQVAENVLSEVEPAAIAIEMPPGGTPGGAGMGAAYQYAQDNDVPAFVVDKPRRAMRESVDSYLDLTRDANKFSHEIEPNGDLNEQAIFDARNRIHEQYGAEAYNEMYRNREERMARRVAWLGEEYDGPVAWFGGVFHIKAMSERVSLITRDVSNTGALPIEASPRILTHT